MAGLTRYSDNWLQKFSRLYLQSVSQRHDVQKTDVTLAPLDPAYVIPMQVGQFRQLLLRQTEFEPERTNSLAKQCTGVLGSHIRIM